jgi:hypothetical protein
MARQPRFALADGVQGTQYIIHFQLSIVSPELVRVARAL